MRAFLETLPRGFPAANQQVVVFTHGGAIKYLLREVLQFDPTLLYPMPVENTSITRLELTITGPLDAPRAQWVLHSFNDAAHLEGI